MPNTDGADQKKAGVRQPAVKRLGSRPGSAVPGNAKTKKLPTRGRPAHGGRR